MLFSLLLSTNGQGLEVLYEWIYLDYTWPSPEVRQEATDSGTYIVENNALAGVKVRLFQHVTYFRRLQPSCLTNETKNVHFNQVIDLNSIRIRST